MKPPSISHPLPGAPRGFTLVELVLVIIVVGILGAVGVPRLPEVGVFNRQFDIRQVVSSLSRARAHAMASQCHVFVGITDDELTARVDDACGTLAYNDTRDFSVLSGSTRLQFVSEGLSNRSPGVTGPSLPVELVFTPEGEARTYTGTDLSAVSVVPGGDLADFSSTSLSGVSVAGTFKMTHASDREVFIDDTTGYVRWQ